MGEPWYNFYQSKMEIQARLRAETSAVFMKSVFTFALVAYCEMGIEGFGIAQVIYGFTYLVVMTSYSESFASFYITPLALTKDKDKDKTLFTPSVFAISLDSYIDPSIAYNAFTLTW